MKKRKIVVILVYIAVLALAFSWMFGLFGSANSGLTYSQVVDQFVNENVRNFTVSDNRIYLQLHEPFMGEDELVARMADTESFRAELWNLIQEQKATGILESYDFVPEKSRTPYDYIVPIVLSGLILIVLWILLVGRANSNNPMANSGSAH